MGKATIEIAAYTSTIRRTERERERDNTSSSLFFVQIWWNIANMDHAIAPAFRRKPFHLTLPRPTNEPTNRNRSFHALLLWPPFRATSRCETTKNQISRQTFDRPASKLPSARLMVFGLWFSRETFRNCGIGKTNQIVRANVHDEVSILQFGESCY